MARNAIVFASLLAIVAAVCPAEVEAGWAVDGAPVCVWSGDQEFPVICSDGAGGAIIAWEDVRGYRDIYAQRLDENGRAVWAEGGIPICAASYGQVGPRICSDGAGGAIIAWTDPRASGSRDIYAQRVSPDGAVLWAPDGIAICSETAHQHLNDICSDGAGGAILVWQDERVSTSYDDLYCQRIDEDGNSLWNASGVPLRVGGYLKEWARLVSDIDGGAIFTWIDWEAAQIRAQRVDGSGAVMWAVNGVAVRSASGYPYEPEIVEDGYGGAIISWTDHRDWYDIYAQRIYPDGDTFWEDNGEAITTDPPGEDWWQHHARMCSDGDDGAIIAWIDQRVGASDCYAQRIDGGGRTKWTENGVPVCTTQASTAEIDLIGLSDKGAIITWQDLRSGVGSDIYAQRLDSLGNIVWAVNGVPLCTAEGSQRYPKATTDGMDGAIIAWQDERIFMNDDIFAHRITNSGGFVATLLQSYSARWIDVAVLIEWTLSEVDADARFVVSRTEGAGGDFAPMPEEYLQKEGLDFAYTDTECLPGGSYRYEVTVETESGTRLLFETDLIRVPTARIALHQNHPNPFNPTTAFEFYIPAKCRVSLEVYNAAGALIRTLVDAELDAGEYRERWDGTNEAGNRVGSGVYFYRLEAGKEIRAKKMVLLR